MELYFQEKLSLKGKVDITDAEGNVVYTGKRSSWSGKLILKDAEGKKIVTIGQGQTIFTKGFYIKKGKKVVARMKQKFSLVNQKYKIKKLDWDVKGNFLAKEYTITKGDEAIAEITKKKLVSLLEAYSINIHDEEKVPEILGVVLILNQILKSKKLSLIKK